VRRFHELFICLNASKEGFLHGCRPFIGMCLFWLMFLVYLLKLILYLHFLCLLVKTYRLLRQLVNICKSRWLLHKIKHWTTNSSCYWYGTDRNHNIFHVAFGVVDKEDYASWLWFLTQLKYCIGESRQFGNYTIHY
jgi:hypothetical protein